MRKEIKHYKKQLEKILNDNSPNTDWEKLSCEVQTKIGFFQHERLVHLIVTMSVAIMCILSILAASLTENAPLPLIILVGLFVILLAPYIIYYYMLENAVQDIYRYYDKVREKCGKQTAETAHGEITLL